MEPIAAWTARGPRLRRLALRLVGVGVVVALASSVVLLAVITGFSADDAAQATTTNCQSVGGVTTTGLTIADLDAQQMATATAIIGIAKGLAVPAQGWVVALAASLQESGLRPLPFGDRDSIGPFQQRAAWGPFADRLDPATSARMFFLGGQSGEPGLLAVPGWEQLPVTVAAQAVQVSAFPDAYAKQVPLAAQLVQEIGGVTAPVSCDGGTATVVGGYALPLPGADVHPPLPDHWDHQPAVDLPAPTGTAVFAVAGGTVSYTQNGNACGMGISITDQAGAVWTYCHMSDRLVDNGSTVTTGQSIALVGTTGESSGPHLHLQVQVGGALACPQPFLDALAAQQPPPPLGSLGRSECA
jgi:murein DD-endopeptidase MepM/ murein hydrolase activator NlpD